MDDIKDEKISEYSENVYQIDKSIIKKYDNPLNDTFTDENLLTIDHPEGSSKIKQEILENDIDIKEEIDSDIEFQDNNDLLEISKTEIQEVKSLENPEYQLENYTTTHEIEGVQILKDGNIIVKSSSETFIQHKCADCQKTFNSNRDLFLHAKQFHPNYKNFKCQYCNLCFTGSSKLKLHIKSTHDDSSYNYVCKFCMKSFSDISLLARHLLLHTGEHLKETKTGYLLTNSEEYRYCCSVCKKKFKTWNELKIHGKSHIATSIYEPSPPTLSEACLEVFKSHKEFIIHAKQYHPDFKAFKCEDCGLLCCNMPALIRHQESHSEQTSNFDESVNSRNTIAKQVNTDSFLVQEKKEIFEIKYIDNKIEDILNDQIDKNNKNYNNYNNLKSNLGIKEEEITDDTFQYTNDQKNKNNKNYNNLKYNLEIKEEEIYTEDVSQHTIDHIKLAADPLAATSSTRKNIKNEETAENLSDSEKNSAVNSSEETSACQEENSLIERIESPVNSSTELKCAICRKVYKRKSYFQIHVKQCRPNVKVFECKHCDESFSSLIPLQRHINQNHNSIMKHKCEFCSKGFNKYTNYKVHLRTHTGEQPFSCSLCTQTFKHNISLQNHIKRFHPESVMLYKCAFGLCKEEFKFYYDLTKHVKQFHPNLNALKCRHCCKLFSTRFQLTNHLRIMHNDLFELKRYIQVRIGENPYSCSMCEKSYKKVMDLRKHYNFYIYNTMKRCRNIMQKSRIRNPKQKPRIIECGICDKILAKNSLIVHNRQFHPNYKFLKCQYCDKSFSRVIQLNHHKKNEHTKVPTIKHICEYCSKGFKITTNYKSHLRSHTGEKPFSCSLCEKSFKHNISLQNHLRNHSQSNEAIS